MKAWQKKKILAGAILASSPIILPRVHPSEQPTPTDASVANVVKLDDGSVANRVGALEQKAFMDSELAAKTTAELKSELNGIHHRLRELEGLASRVIPLLPPVPPPGS